MLGRRDPQRGLFGAQARLVPEEAVGQLGIYSRLAEKPVFRDDDFADVYSPIGRPSVPPSIFATCCLLQIEEDISDREVVRRTRFDARWKLVFDLDPCSIEPLFARSSYEAFKARLALHKKEAIGFERSVKHAVEHGVVSKKILLALDGTPVTGRGAVKDAFNLLSDAIAKIVREIAHSQEKKSEDLAREFNVERHLEAGSIKGSVVVDWDDQESVSRFIADLLADGTRVVQAAEQADCASDEVVLLRTVVAENVDQSAEQPKIARGVPKERTASVHDPEIHHGRKSSGKLYTGHKAHFATDTESQIITAVTLTAPSAAEGAQVTPLVTQTRELTGAVIEESLGDCAYSTRKAQEQAKEAGVELKTKMPSPPKGRFGPRDFDVSEDGKSARCPAGHSSSKLGKRNIKLGDEKVACFLHTWTEDLCGACAMKDECLNKPRKGEPRKREQRTLLVPPDFHDRRGREDWARSEEGRALLRERTAVEHVIGRVKNQGGGQARYFGRAKTLVQLLWTAALVNFKQIWNRTTAQPEQIAAAAAILLACLLSQFFSPIGRHTLARTQSVEVDERPISRGCEVSLAPARTPPPLLDAALALASDADAAQPTPGANADEQSRSTEPAARHVTPGASASEQPRSTEPALRHVTPGQNPDEQPRSTEPALRHVTHRRGSSQRSSLRSPPVGDKRHVTPPLLDAVLAGVPSVDDDGPPTRAGPAARPARARTPSPPLLDAVLAGVPSVDDDGPPTRAGRAARPARERTPSPPLLDAVLASAPSADDDDGPPTRPGRAAIAAQTRTPPSPLLETALALARAPSADVGARATRPGCAASLAPTRELRPASSMPPLPPDLGVATQPPPGPGPPARTLHVWSRARDRARLARAPGVAAEERRPERRGSQALPGASSVDRRYPESGRCVSGLEWGASGIEGKRYCPGLARFWC